MTALGSHAHNFFVAPDFSALGAIFVQKSGFTKMGRPAFKATPALRQAVFELKRKHLSNDRIARHLGINRQTLAKHFWNELEAASDALEAELIEAMWRAARRGKASAIIWLSKRIARARAGAASLPPRPTGGR